MSEQVTRRSREFEQYHVAVPALAFSNGNIPLCDDRRGVAFRFDDKSKTWPRVNQTRKVLLYRSDILDRHQDRKTRNA